MVIPWLLSLAIAGAGALSLDGIERAIAVGGFTAAAVGALLALTQLRRVVASLRTWMVGRENDLSTFADDRAAAVARQFAWAVNELVAARAELRRTDALRVKAEEIAASTAAEARRDAEELRIVRAKLAEVEADGLGARREQLEQAEAAVKHEERERAES